MNRYPIYPYLGTLIRCEEEPVAFPPQRQARKPGLEWPMRPPPIFDNPGYQAAGKLTGKVALITGGDSGIGRAVAVAFAREGAAVAIVYLDEHTDAEVTCQYIAGLGGRCLAVPADLRRPPEAQRAVRRTLETLGRLDVLVNNAAIAYRNPSVLDVTEEELEETFRSNVFSWFYITKAALPHLPPGSAIVNTVSDAAYTGRGQGIAYTASKGATVSFTRALARSLVGDGIRVNGVSPGPVWTPLIPSSFRAGELITFGTGTPMGRAAQPFELAPAYVYLASDDSRYMTGQIIHVNGGTPIAT